MDYAKLGERIRSARKNQKLSQDQLANMVAVSRVYISQLETGERVPSLELLIALANTLNVSADDLIQDSLTAEHDEAELNAIYRNATASTRRLLLDLTKAIKTVLKQHDIK